MIESRLARGYGTLAGVVFIGAALLAVPSTLLLEPTPSGDAYLLTLAALATGFLCMALPWERINPNWLNLFGVLATIQVAAAVEVFGQSFLALYFVVALAMAYVASGGRVLAGHVILIGLALLGPVAYGSESARMVVQQALIVFPNLVIATAITAYLRRRLVTDRASYRRFAAETLELANRIAGRPLEPSKLPQERLGALEISRRLRMPTRIAAGAATIFAIPLLVAAIAVAGVRLPAFAAEAFENAGVDLPNQESQQPVQPSALEPLGPDPAVAAAETEAKEKKTQGAKRRSRASKGKPGRSKSRTTESGAEAAGAPAGADAGQQSAAPPADGGTAPVVAPAPAPDPVRRILDTAGGAVRGLIGDGTQDPERPLDRLLGGLGLKQPQE